MPAVIEVIGDDGVPYKTVPMDHVPDMIRNQDAYIRQLHEQLGMRGNQQQHQTQQPANSAPPWVPLAEKNLARLVKLRPDADIEDLRAIARANAETTYESQMEMRRELQAQLQEQAAKSQFEGVNQMAQNTFGVNLRADRTYLQIYNEYPNLTPEKHYRLWLMETGRGGQSAQAPATTNGINGAAASRSNGSVYATPGIGGGPANEAQMSPFMRAAFDRNPEMKPGHPNYERFYKMVADDEKKYVNQYGGR